MMICTEYQRLVADHADNHHHKKCPQHCQREPTEIEQRKDDDRNADAELWNNDQSVGDHDDIVSQRRIESRRAKRLEVVQRSSEYSATQMHAHLVNRTLR